MRYPNRSESLSIPQRLLFVPLKETLIFPYAVAPLFLAEIYELREKVRTARMPRKVEEVAYKEISRLERMNPVT